MPLESPLLKCENSSFENLSPEITIERIFKADEQLIAQIDAVQRVCFPEKMIWTEEQIRTAVEDPEGINLIIKNKNGVIVGFLSSEPQNQTCRAVKHLDPEIRRCKKGLHVLVLAIKPESRSLSLVLQLKKFFFEEVRSQGFKKITMYARMVTNLSKILQKRYQAKLLRTIENWHDYGECFQYLEINLKRIHKISSAI